MIYLFFYSICIPFQSLAGHFGGAWQTQRIDFAMFPGPVVITTNCVIEALKSYKHRLYTLNETGVPGIQHLDLNNRNDMDHLLKVERYRSRYSKFLV